MILKKIIPIAIILLSGCAIFNSHPMNASLNKKANIIVQAYNHAHGFEVDAPPPVYAYEANNGRTGFAFHNNGCSVAWLEVEVTRSPKKIDTTLRHELAHYISMELYGCEAQGHPLKWNAIFYDLLKLKAT